jgi:hypothetical protein
MNQFDPRAMHACAVAAGVYVRDMYAPTAAPPVVRRGDTTDDHGREDTGGNSEDSSVESSGPGSVSSDVDNEDNGGANDESAEVSSQEPDDEGTGGGYEAMNRRQAKRNSARKIRCTRIVNQGTIREEGRI